MCGMEQHQVECHARPKNTGPDLAGRDVVCRLPKDAQHLLSMSSFGRILQTW